MRRSNTAVLLFEPSLASGTATVLLTFVLLLLANFSYLLRSGLIYDFVFGQNSPVDLIQSSRDTVSTLNQTVFGNSTLNQILFFGFWMMIGLFVYVAIVSVGQSLSETGTDLKSLGYMHARKALIERNLLVRTAIRVGGILGACLYGWVFMRFLLPFSVYATRVGLSQLEKISGWGYVLLGGVVLMLSIHVIVIIARVVMVRPRVFGSWDSILTSR